MKTEAAAKTKIIPWIVLLLCLSSYNSEHCIWIATSVVFMNWQEGDLQKQSPPLLAHPEE